jgi:hypothetical protein
MYRSMAHAAVVVVVVSLHWVETEIELWDVCVVLGVMGAGFGLCVSTEVL